MKTNRTFLLLMLITLVASCKPNVPELNEKSHELLNGTWQVTKETVTNGDGFGGVFTREVNDDRTLVFSGNELGPAYSGLLGGLCQPVSPTRYYVPEPYTLQQQDNGTWLLTVEEYYDKQRNLVGGCSPITIHKLTKNDMEWEYESYGGDEGPVVYYQYLKRIQ